MYWEEIIIYKLSKRLKINNNNKKTAFKTVVIHNKGSFVSCIGIKWAISFVGAAVCFQHARWFMKVDFITSMSCGELVPSAASALRLSPGLCLLPSPLTLRFAFHCNVIRFLQYDWLQCHVVRRRPLVLCSRLVSADTMESWVERGVQLVQVCCVSKEVSSRVACSWFCGCFW